MSKGYASITQLYTAFNDKIVPQIKYGCKLFLEAHINKISFDQLFHEDVDWLETFFISKIINDKNMIMTDSEWFEEGGNTNPGLNNTNISMSLLLLWPCYSLIDMLRKAEAIELCHILIGGEEKINHGCQLFLQAHSNNLTLGQLFKKDDIWLKSSFINKAINNEGFLKTDNEWLRDAGFTAIKGNSKDISMSLLSLWPFENLFEMLKKGNALEYYDQFLTALATDNNDESMQLIGDEDINVES